VRTIRAIQRDFTDQPLSTNPAYSADARAFVIDTDRLIRGDEFMYGRERLRMVLDIVKQVGDLGNQGFCLQLLEMAARLDEDVKSAEEYVVAMREVRGILRGETEGDIGVR
jgi:hypothetical protein